MFVGNNKKVMDTLIDECTQKKLAKSGNFFIWVYHSGNFFLLESDDCMVNTYSVVNSQPED